VIPKYSQDSDWRKPAPGMLLAAAEEMDIDLTRSWVIGDNQRDIEAGRQAGCRTILLRSASADQEHTETDGPDYVAVNIREAANMIKRLHRAEQDAAADEAGDETEAVSDEEYSVTAIEAEELRIEPVQTEATPAAEEPALTDQDTAQLLREILEQLRRNEKTDMFGEFSIMRLLAGIVQVFVVFCLLMGLWYLMRPDPQTTALFTALGFGVVLQTMALTFYIMQGRR
jgi:hypothetical protein